MVVPAARVVFTAEDRAEIAASVEQILATGAHLDWLPREDEWMPKGKLA